MHERAIGRECKKAERRHLDAFQQSGKAVNENGSSVEVVKSKQASGRWGTSSQSDTPPARNWAYDPLFRTTPPPGTLVITTYNKQRWYRE